MSVSTTRFFVAHHAPIKASEFLENAFRPFPEAHTVDPVFGWTDATDSSAPPVDINYPPYLLLGFRADYKALNASAFKMRLKARILEIKEQRGLERLGKNHRREIKEALQEEMLRNSPAIPKTCLVTFEPTDTAGIPFSGYLTVYSSTPALVDLAVKAFTDAVTAPGLAVVPISLATLIDPTQALDAVTSPQSTNLAAFLLWVWNAVAQAGSLEIRVDSPTAKAWVPVILWIQDRAVFFHEKERVTVRVESPLEAEESVAALARGCDIQEFVLGATIFDESYTWTLKSATPQSCKLPRTAVKAAAQDVGATFATVALTETVQNVIKALYLQFLAERDACE